MKKFSVPCNFNGARAPFTIYLGAPEEGHHPLHFQADWLSKERNGQIPAEIMESIQKLKELAEKNNVSFEELCVYALGTAEGEQPDEDSSYEEETEPLEAPIYEEIEKQSQLLEAESEEEVNINDLYDLKETPIDENDLELDFKDELENDPFAEIEQEEKAYTEPFPIIEEVSPQQVADPFEMPTAEEEAIPELIQEEQILAPPENIETPIDQIEEPAQNDESLFAGLQKAFEDLHMDDESKTKNADLFASTQKDKDTKEEDK